MVNFQSFNLLDDPTRLGTFDIVLCRNVLIYFDQPTKAAVLERIASRLAPTGALLLGAAESIFGITAAFTAVAICVAFIARWRQTRRHRRHSN